MLSRSTKHTKAGSSFIYRGRATGSGDAAEGAGTLGGADATDGVVVPAGC
jgi:hypothetical protein